jgi:hypothetical protein
MSLARRYYAGRVGIGSTDAGAASPDATEEVNLFGTPEEVVDKIEVLREAFSSDEIMFEVNWTSSVPREVVMNTLRCSPTRSFPSSNRPDVSRPAETPETAPPYYCPTIVLTSPYHPDCRLIAGR